MFLSKITIKNFRCLENVELNLDDYTVLIGENNAGKTAILDVLKNILGRTNTNITFNEYDYFFADNNCTPHNSDGIEIILNFKERIADEWNDDIISIFEKCVQPSEDGSDLYGIFLKVTSKYNEATQQFEVAYKFLNNKLEELRSENKDVVNLIKHNPVFYLQALRNSNDVFSSSSYMWGKFLKQVKLKSEDLDEIHQEIEKLNNDIISTDENLKTMINSMNDIDKILGFNNEENVSVNALPLKSWDLLSRAQLTLKSKEDISLPIDKYGQGTQSMSIMLLYQAYVDILMKGTYGRNAEAILTIEEPEAHLHPQAIRAFEKRLKNFETQKIITTHSPYFIQNADLLNIRLLRKQNGRTEILSISRSVELLITEDEKLKILKKIANNFQNSIEVVRKVLVAKETIGDNLAKSLTGLFKENPMEINSFIDKSQNIFNDEELAQLNMFVQRNRGDIFFARGWLLAEGQTESVLFPYFAKRLGYDLDENGISYIDYRSNGSAKAFTKLAKVFRYKWVLLADNDEQGIRTLSEIKANGYADEEIDNIVRKTESKDIESDLVQRWFLEDYEVILSEEIKDNNLEDLKANDIDKYKSKLIKLIQEGKGKVKNAYKLVERLEERNMPITEIPDYIKYLIEEVCRNE